MDGALVTYSSSSSNSAQTGRWTYDVFLSFRGEDTRNNFVDHLYAALDQAGIYTFKDDKKLQRGKSIFPELVKAIQESMVAVVVFSTNYANSSWCLEELAKIIECRDLMGQRVLPVFYDVDPSDVRGQKRSFHTAFEQHEEKLIDNMDKVKRWREALVTTANLSGWDVSKIDSGHEAECIKRIVKTILSFTGFDPEENLIDMESRVQHVKCLLGKGCGDVCIIGIWGMGGIGKTTIARAVYNQISFGFDGCCFLEDIRENGCDKRGLKSLQEKLLSEILMEEHFNVKDCDDGICQIRRRLGRKKVLVVLDDVDDIKQLEFLSGACEWFGPGSRIMVTTRDEHLLCYAHEKYAPELLKETEAIKLFSRYAFKANIPPKAYNEVSRAVVRHTGHLPLALKILGSHFCGRNLEFWQSGLNVLAKIPHKEINGILKISFDGLNIFEKKIFLHIAYLFKGWERRYATRILDSFGYEAVSGITVLIEKSLLTIVNGDLHMHDLIQEMGLFIVHECYPHTMLWHPEQIQEAMMKYDILEIVEAIVPKGEFESNRSGEVFKSMKKLMLFQVKGQFTTTEPNCFREELRWLFWSCYPFQSLSITTCMTKLVGLEIPFGKIERLQIEEKAYLTNLKFMNLCNSYKITSFPDVSGFPNLETLNLSYCMQLVEVHESVFHHEKIIHLNLSYCSNLKILSSSIDMKSLCTLRLKYCKSIERFPEVSGEMGRLVMLDIDGCRKIKELPLSAALLTGLVVLKMGLTSLLKLEQEQSYSNRLPLNSRENDLVIEDLSTDVSSLDLSWNFIIRVPERISQVSHLKYLDLSYCYNLMELLELPSQIQVLRADGCKSLQKIGDLSSKYKWLFKISLRDCYKLPKDQKSQIYLAKCLMKSSVQKCAGVNHRLSIAFPGRKIPNWFNKQFGYKTALNLPKNQITRMKGLAVCCSFRSPRAGATLRVKFKASVEGKLIVMPEPATSTANHVWIGYMPIDLLENVCHGFEYEDVIISFKSLSGVMECGVCVVYKDDIRPVSGTGSWIPDYDDLERIEYGTALQHERSSVPSFVFGKENTGARNSVHIDL